MNNHLVEGLRRRAYRGHLHVEAEDFAYVLLEVSAITY